MSQLNITAILADSNSEVQVETGTKAWQLFADNPNVIAARVGDELKDLAYELDDGDAVVVTGCRSPRLNVGFGPDSAIEDVYPALHRWRIDTATGTVTDEPLDDRPGDFPRINDNHAGLDARYGYVAHSSKWGDNEVIFDGVVKHDFENDTSALASYGTNVSSGEAAFAPDPTRTDEDAGWLLNFVHDLDTDTSNFVVLDAQSLDEVARVRLPRRVPVGFHGAWFTAEG